MKPKHIVNLASCATAVATLLSGNAYAASSIPTYTQVKRLSSASGDIVIGEFTSRFSSSEVGYEVDVANGVSLHLFAVSHNESFLTFFTAPNGWNVRNVAKADWADGYYGFSGVSGSDIGSFDSLFGIVDTHVIVFTAPSQFVSEDESSPGFLTDTNSNVNLQDVEEAGWSSGSFSPRFLRAGNDSSEFIALNSTGAIIGQSIPEPSGLLLGGIGLLAVLRRRR